jgi:N-acetyl-alpha-D-glucosaminyl L-malate synthase BshA
MNGKGPKLITTLHGTDITLVGLEPSFLPIVKFSIEQSDGVTAVSRFLREKTLSNYNIEKDIKVIPNFVDTNVYRRVNADNLRARCSDPGDAILTHTSNFRPVKRVVDVIRIFHEVNRNIPATLLLIGDGPDRSQCELLVRDLGIQKKVHFLGKQIDLVELLSASDLFLMPSQSESFGLSALEAMACGVPVISSSVGGLPELQVHSETGFIAEMGDVPRMAKYCIDLLRNPQKLSLFSRAARQRAESFESSIVVSQYVRYYETVLSR